MAAGFRKSLFGFNCTDVMEYIEKSQKTFVKNEKDLTEQVEKLSKELRAFKPKLRGAEQGKGRNFKEA